jgi:hypothetical protein
MKLYRDCSANGADFDNPAVLGIYQRIGGNYTFVQTATVTYDNPIGMVPPPENPCLILPSNVCVQEAIYRFTISNLPVISGSYIISWQRCCRNNSITNIFDPRTTGATMTVEITSEAQQVCNDGPTFRDFPPTVICINEPVAFDHSAVDSEGDQLVYEFCAPLEGGGTLGSNENPGDQNACEGITPDPIICLPPYTDVTFIGPNYSVINPLGGNPKVGINPITGMIDGIPQLIGQFVVGVCVKEYRNGLLLSILRRDFQFRERICD